MAKNPQIWILEKITERGQNMLIDKLPPSPAMIEYFKQEKPGETLPKTVAEWLEKLEISQTMRKEWKKYKKSLQQAERIELNEQEKQEFDSKTKQIERKIQQIAEEHFKQLQQDQDDLPDTPTHPVLDRWDEIQSMINDAPDKVKQKLSLIYNAKRDIAEKQKLYTDLFIKMTSHEHKGYQGWNKKIKKEMEYFVEASQYLVSIFNEMNCVSRTLFSITLLKKANIFYDESIFINRTYKHMFLSICDELGITRKVEPSDKLSKSVFVLPVNKDIFRYIDYKVIVNYPLNKSLIPVIINNIGLQIETYKHYLNVLCLNLNELDFTQWENLSKYLKSIDSLYSLSRSYSIVFYINDLKQLLINKFKENKVLIRNHLNNKLLCYIKLNLLIIKSRLEKINITNFDSNSIKEIEKMKRNINDLLNILTKIQTPYNLSIDNISMSQLDEIAWNPDLFPKPFIDKGGEVGWIMPNDVSNS